MITLSNKISKILHYFKRPEKTSLLAKERLQIIIAHERAASDQPDYLASLQQDLVDVISKYVPVDKQAIKVELARQNGCAILELNVTLPDAR